MAEIERAGIVTESTNTYTVEGAKQFIADLQEHPNRLAKFIAAANQRAHDIFDQADLSSVINRGDKVLYVGAGTGHVAQVIEDTTQAKAIKLDIADLRTPDTKDNRFVKADARDLPIRDGSCQVVMLNNILHFYEADDQSEMLSQALRALTPGGKLVVLEDTMPPQGNRMRKPLEAIFGKFDDLLNRQPAGVTPHAYRSIDEWKQLATANGFAPEGGVKSVYWGPTDLIPKKGGPGSKDTGRSLLRPFESTHFVFTKPPSSPNA